MGNFNYMDSWNYLSAEMCIRDRLEKAVSGLKKAPIDGSGNNQGAQNNNQKPSTGGSGSNGSVKTGDSSDVMLWGIFAAAALMAGVVVKKKKA